MINKEVILKKITNPVTIIAVASGLALLAKEVGFDVDLGKVDTIVNLVLSMLIAMGILNNPDTPGLS